MGLAWRGSLLVAGALGCAATPPAFPEATDTTDTTGAPDSSTGAASTDEDDDGGSTTAPGPASTSAPLDDSTTTLEGTESTGSTPAVCGDGIPQADEDCDDANRSEIDGCTSACALGPVGVDRVGGPQASEILFYDGDPAPEQMDADCPPGEAIVGLDAGWPKGVGGFIVHCGALELLDADPTMIVVDTGTTLAPVGPYPGDDIALDCPAGEALAGLIAAGSNNGGIYGLGGSCRTFEVTGTASEQSLSIEDGASLEYQGFGNPQDSTACPPQSVATGITVQMLSSGWPVGIGLRCHALELTYP